MASKPVLRSFQTLARRSRPICECASPASRAVSLRQLSTFTPVKDETETSTEIEGTERPRWSYTPEKMKSPFPFKNRIKDTRIEWECNNSPTRLDKFYVNFLGRGGEQMLSDEIKWLAVTHKSFDQGRRGFNDRLAFLGRRILNLQTNLALLNSPVGTKTQSAPDPSDDRVPFQHPSLDSLQNLSDVPMTEVLTKRRLAGLGKQFGLQEVIRWLPRNVTNLESSGVDVVLTSAIYAIIGAVALQRGGDVAAAVAREKVLKPLGIA